MASELECGIERLIAPALESMGYAVVRVKLTGRPGRTLQIMAERREGTPVTIDDCREISRAVSALLDVEDPIAGSYNLEVSSPGIDRPLVRSTDFERFAGHVAKIQTRRPLDGRKHFRGELLGVSGGHVRVVVDGGVAAIPVAEIVAAKLVLTDELMAESAKGEPA